LREAAKPDIAGGRFDRRNPVCTVTTNRTIFGRHAPEFLGTHDWLYNILVFGFGEI
jgi:hypothetical protein